MTKRDIIISCFIWFCAGCAIGMDLTANIAGWTTGIAPVTMILLFNAVFHTFLAFQRRT